MYRIPLQTLVDELNSDPEKGLGDHQIEEARSRWGPNRLEEPPPKPVWRRFASNFKEFMILILLIAAVISLAIGEVTDAGIILAIVLLNALLSTYQEIKADASIASLKSLTAPHCVVIRSGQRRDLEAAELVPGDLVLLEAGNFVPADGRLIQASSLKVEESTLTGESVPVDKFPDRLEGEALPLGDQHNMVFSGTVVTYGSGRYIVTATGMATELGRIADLIHVDKETLTPLQMKLKEIGKILGLIVLLVSAAIFTLGIIQGRDWFEMFFTAVSLAVAAIPEGLPAIVTIVLALGVRRLSQKKAVIRRLPAVETLGSSSVICSDKTGTLTLNRMVVQETFTFGKSDLEVLHRCAALCNDASLEGETALGDPTETALLSYVSGTGVDLNGLSDGEPRLDALPFDSDRKLMTTLHEKEDRFILYTKGAVDELLSRCSHLRFEGNTLPMTKAHIRAVLEKNETWANNALRVLAFAVRVESKRPDPFSIETVEKDLVFVGLMAMMDPPRNEARGAIARCLEAGIRPVMITGDHKVTAGAIATQLGILRQGDRILTGSELEKMDDLALTEQIEQISVFARVAPEHKVRIVKAWQRRDQVVAMTGDGVNDAPALRMAEIGIAMGKVGTDVSRSAAAMVLMDDNFATIVDAIEEGRGIYANIRKSIRYLLSCNFGEIILLLMALIMNRDVPLLPIHILWVNLVTDSFPALALGVEPVDEDLLSSPPRKKDEGLFSEGLVFKIGLEGLLVGVLSLGIFLYGHQFGLATARTMTFLTLAFSQLVHSMNVRSDESVLFVKGLFTNRYALYAVALSAGLQLLIVTLPPLQQLFRVTPLTSLQWLVVIFSSLMPLLVVELVKTVRLLGSHL